MLVFVSGNLQLAGEQHALKFSQDTGKLKFSKCLFWITALKHNLVKIREANYPRNVKAGFVLCWPFAVLTVLLELIDIKGAVIAQRIMEQMFHLMPTPQGSFYVYNDIFRLNYA
ncbi:hypothetical protein OSB04_000014 [Centaurea solstitialis]|uniref:NTF2 domain-containing protein n=1 Tax=Centaurea solstitialis TaxID=347529 RepID=A0AA38TVR1_9ASTR|nr:hypothetical protein OSB04_000014 [Centaurea solstitialis]